jgi:hypothetical protein
MPSAESSLYAEVQPVFAYFICKDNDYCGIIGKFVATFRIVYRKIWHTQDDLDSLTISVVKN